MRWVCGVVVAAVLAVLAGCAGPADPNGLPVSSWEVGDDAALAQVTGVVRFDDAGCTYLGRDGSASLLVWPTGYSHATRDDQQVVLDPDGDVVLADGDRIETNGATYPQGDGTFDHTGTDDCTVTAPGELTVIMDDPEA